MPNAIRTDSRNNRTTGFAVPGLRDGRAATVTQQVHDGDTISVQADGNLGVRFLGIDTPEVSFGFPPEASEFVAMDDPRWNEFLSDPLSSKWGEFSSPIPERLRHWIAARSIEQGGSNHHRHAQRATDALRQMITDDMAAMNRTVESFGYYLRFGFEVMDGYGRLLCSVNRNQPKADDPGPRPPTYNMRLLRAGLAFPYFIFPNINPFDRPESVMQAVIPPGSAAVLAREDSELRMARAAVQDARNAHRGLFDAMDPCALQPFELRMLSRRSPPSRWLIDLSSDSSELIHPLNYPLVPNPEDRLWIPPEYVPLFAEAGWRRNQDLAG